MALEDIEIGTLILKEKPQFINSAYVFGRLLSVEDHLSSIMDSFFSMNENDQKEFLKLSNKYLDPNSLKREWKRFAQVQEEKGISNAQFHVDRNFVLKIICIFFSNSCTNRHGHARVGINFSRFNHSCSSNAENTNNDDGDMIIRATFKIKVGEEIAINVDPVGSGMKNKKARHDELGFICLCELCKEEDINNDDETYKKFQKLQKETEKARLSYFDEKITPHRVFDFIEKAISCQKQMYNLAENKKASKTFILAEISFECFASAVYGYNVAKKLVFDMGRKEFVGKLEYFKEECEKLAKNTLQMVKTYRGNDSEVTRMWEKWSQNIENWFKNPSDLDKDLFLGSRRLPYYRN